MQALAPIALTGLASLILLEILKIIMEPVVAWLLVVLAIGLKITLGVALLGAAIYFARRYYRSQNGVVA